MPYRRIDMAAQQAQQALQQIRQIAQQLEQNELQNVRQFQQGSTVNNFDQREQNAAQQLSQIQQIAQQLQSSLGASQSVQGYGFTGNTPQNYGTEFASETNVQEVRRQNQQSADNKQQ